MGEILVEDPSSIRDNGGCREGGVGGEGEDLARRMRLLEQLRKNVKKPTYMYMYILIANVCVHMCA